MNKYNKKIIRLTEPEYFLNVFYRASKYIN